MDDQILLAERFEAHRSHLRSVAYRMLGSSQEADDAVQEAWLRLHRSDAGEIDNLAGWLTTVVARVSLDMLRARRSRREEPAADEVTDPAGRPASEDGPEDEAVLADSVGSALLVVLDTLAPAERLAFVLHDNFGVPHEEIAAILGRSTNAAKQLASRARSKVRGVDPSGRVGVERQREVVDAFLAASRSGDFDALLALLHPDIVLEADAVAVRMGAAERLVGASAVAESFAGRAQGAQAALLDGAVGFVWMVAGRAKVAWEVTVDDGKVTHIEMLADPDRLDLLDIVR